MTDDLFEDFDLKSSADSRNEDDIKLEEDIVAADSEKNAEPSSESLHPDIFSGDGEVAVSEDEIRNLNAQIDSERTVANNIFSFSDENKEPFEKAEEKFNYAAEEIVAEVRTIDKIRRSNVRIDPEHFGDTLRRLREAACVSAAALSEELRIKESFIVALEREDYASLPPEVFIIAYIRKLGGVYRLTEDEILALTSKVRERMEVEVPEDMGKVVAIYEPSEENENKMHHIIMVFTIVITVVILLIGAGIYFFVSSRSGDENNVKIPKNKTEERFSSETIIKLQPQVKLQPRPLKISK